MADTFKFRIDHHGSLIRPAELLAARGQRAEGTLDDEGLRAVEDQAIADAVTMQRRLNLSVVTDGEFRRADFRSAVFAAVGGFLRTEADIDGLALWTAHGELNAGGPLIAADVAAVAAQTLIPAKATLPSPAYLAAQCFDPEVPGTPWKSAADLGQALARIIREEVELLISRGIRYIQINNPGYARHLSGQGPHMLSLDESIAVDTLAVGLDAKPDDVRIGLCPTIHASATVDRSVAERLFSELPADRWILPYCTGSDAEVLLLRAVPADRDACLGVVDPATPDLEDIDTVMERMDVAAELKDIEDIAVSPSAGFSDVAGRTAVGHEDQRRKLVHVETIARMCWGNEL